MHPEPDLVDVKISEKEPDISIIADRYPVSQSTFTDYPPVVRVVFSNGDVVYMNFNTYAVLATNFQKSYPIQFEVFAKISSIHYIKETNKKFSQQTPYGINPLALRS
jgi:hypothetical protein